MQKTLKSIITACVALFLLGMAGLFYLSVRYVGEPVTPRPDLGKTIPWNNHGTIHYITPIQAEAEDLVRWAVIGLFFLVVALIALRNMSSHIGLNQPPSA